MGACGCLWRNPCQWQRPCCHLDSAGPGYRGSGGVARQPEDGRVLPAVWEFHPARYFPLAGSIFDFVAWRLLRGSPYLRTTRTQNSLFWRVLHYRRAGLRYLPGIRPGPDDAHALSGSGLVPSHTPNPDLRSASDIRSVAEAASPLTGRSRLAQACQRWLDPSGSSHPRSARRPSLLWPPTVSVQREDLSLSRVLPESRWRWPPHDSSYPWPILKAPAARR